MTLPRLCLLSWIVVLSFCVIAKAENWPQWRGPRGDGTCAEKGLPTTWSRTENVAWKVPLPERGNSTPIVWQDRVFVTQVVEKEGRRTLLCFDRRDGRLAWQQGTVWTEPDPTHGTNPQCAASPVTDGERVVAWFGSAGLFCYDLQGNLLWKRDLGRQRHIWGYGSSPVLHGDLCFLHFGPGERTFLLAVNKKTGETGITLAAGEHWYTRWNVKPFLDRGLVSFVQSDPEWCGGISEWLKICELAKKYPGVQVVPHGHHVLAASACVASQSETLCPMLEYLIQSRVAFQRCQTRPLVAEAGTFAMPDEPGLGPSLDESRMERV